MPVQRGARGSYAKFICRNCRKRKIKCVLPEDVEIRPSEHAQPGITSCQRCVQKGLECVVDFTILGRPSHPRENAMTRVSISSRSSYHISPENQSRLSDNLLDQIDGEEDDQNGVGGYLVVQPQRITDSEEAASIPQQRRLRPADKFQAMTDPAYLLSTMLHRDAHFASQISPRSTPPMRLDSLIDVEVLAVIDQHLVWQRLFYPDMPTTVELHGQLKGLDSQDSECLPLEFLYSLLCLLALEMPSMTLRFPDDIKSRLGGLVAHYAQRTLFILPSHRYTMLALELMAECRPLTLATDRSLACDAVRSRMILPLIREMALGLNLHTSTERLIEHLRSSSVELDTNILFEFLNWYRLCLNSHALSSHARKSDTRQTTDESLEEIMQSLDILLHDNRLPSNMVFALHSLLCQASKIEHILRIKENWQNLQNLGAAIESHKEFCERQQQTLKAALHRAQCLSAGQALVMTQLLDMRLHSAYCWVSGSATFYCVMAGAQANIAENSLQPEHALDVSDQIIERFAEATRHLHTSEAHTEFLVKYGAKRMDDLELGLLNFVSAIDNLKLDGIPYLPPVRSATSHILYMVKDVMEGQAARMKGWGGLHERAHMHLLLIRDCATSLERVGGMVTGETGPQAIAKGCLWAATARILRSLHRLLAEWKEWNALGVAKVSQPSQKIANPADARRLGEDEFLILEEMDFLPDDLFFDWNLWLNDESNAMSFE